MVDLYDTVIIGGGQAGLAMGYHLAERGREHIILERRRVAERWHAERWDSLRFQYPNWALRLPGISYSGDAPDDFSPYPDVAKFIESYATTIKAPVRTECGVTALSEAAGGNGYAVKSGTGTINARQVVIATGPFQRTHIPELAALLPAGLHQTNAARYRQPGQLPDGAVLVVGSGASGHQIADELLSQGRTVYLSLSRHRRVPRRYRGKDAFWWFEKTGRFNTAIDSFPGRVYPPSTVVTGADGGYDIDARRFANLGGKLLGRLIGISDSTLHFGDDANRILGEADKAFADFINAADTSVQRSWSDDGVEPAKILPPINQTNLEITNTLHIGLANIRSVVWCIGYGFDFEWVKVPVLDSRGAPVQTRGVTSCPGIYFLGLHWMHTFKSGQLPFVGEDAAYVAGHIAASPRR